jgi:cell division protein FtsB
MGATNQPSRRGTRQSGTRAMHPVQRWFGESRGVAWGAIFIIAIVVLMLVRPLAMSFFSWHRTASLLQERRAEVAMLETRHEELTEQVDYNRTEAFVAEQARTYGMVRPGETPFVIRELVHPESAAEYAISRLRNATLDHPVALASR